MYKAKTNQWKCWKWNHWLPITSKNVVFYAITFYWNICLVWNISIFMIWISLKESSLLLSCDDETLFVKLYVVGEEKDKTSKN